LELLENIIPGYSSVDEMQKKALKRSLTRTVSHPIHLTSAYSTCFHRCYTSGKYCHSIQKVPIVVRKLPGPPVIRALNPGGRGLARLIQDVRGLPKKLDIKRLSSFASSTMTIEKSMDTPQALPTRHIIKHRAMVALGSNLGDRVSTIEQACEKMPSR
jgi:hypothetical protein